MSAAQVTYMLWPQSEHRSNHKGPLNAVKTRPSGCVKVCRIRPCSACQVIHVSRLWHFLALIRIEILRAGCRTGPSLTSEIYSNSSQRCENRIGFRLALFNLRLFSFSVVPYGLGNSTGV